MYPMISGSEEVDRANALLAEAKAELTSTEAAPAAAPSVASDKAKQFASLARRTSRASTRSTSVLKGR